MKRKITLATIFAASLVSPVIKSNAAENRVETFVESITEKEKKSEAINSSSQKKIRAQFKKKIQDQLKVQGFSYGGNKKDRYAMEAPGFISARQVPPSATIAGPAYKEDMIRLNDLVYLRWSSSENPREGDTYATFTPAVVLQNKEDPTSFEIGSPKNIERLPHGSRLAGYIYETTGLLRITQVTQGLVEARVINVRGQISVGDRVMPPIPKYSKVPEFYSNSEMSATVVAGNPVDRLSTTTGSFLYLNRGMRDGVKLGQVFTALEGINLDIPVHEVPQRYLGTLKVVYVSDAYSTAIITKQFDVIRIGAIVRSQTPEEARESSQENFGNMEALPAEGEVPADQNAKTAESAQPKQLSELDRLEMSMKNGKLTADERARLDDLHKKSTGKTSESSDEEPLSEELPAVTDESGVPEVPTLENSFGSQPSGDKKKDAKKDGKKKKRRDEESLNEMMQIN